MRLATRLLALAGLLLAAPALAQQPSDLLAPERPSGFAEKRLVTASRWMVTAANPLAAEAGAEMLRAGGNAVDAAVAVQLVLGLVEPQSSGLGGGAFLVYWDASQARLLTYDGRETAPLAATPTLFQDAKGEPLKFLDAAVGGRSVGAPGTPRLLHAVHRAHGRLDWAALFAPALRLAENGFAVSPRLAALLQADKERLAQDPGGRAAFFDAAGQPLAAGAVLKNTAYAATLEALASRGPDAFYSGEIAADIVRAVREHPTNPGLLSLEDLALYRVKEREPVCAEIGGGFSACGMGPPSSGGIAVGQILAMARGTFPGPDGLRRLGDASRLAFADRERYVADPDYVPVPVKGLLDPAYLGARAGLLAGPRALDKVEAGVPRWTHARRFAEDPAPELPATSHISIVDAAGNVVSMTTTIEAGFGARIMVRGFLLNNELTDFAFRSHVDGVPVANRVEPGKRPRSSMAPTILFKDGRPYMTVGSPGGSQIIGFVAKTVLAHLDWGLDIQAAISFPNVVNRTGPFELEKDVVPAATGEALKALGYETRFVELTSGLQGIVIRDGRLEGGADPRREGMAIGE